MIRAIFGEAPDDCSPKKGIWARNLMKDGRSNAHLVRGIAEIDEFGGEKAGVLEAIGEEKSEDLIELAEGSGGIE